ncbi:hypothetical protein L202_00340 [Cryptococcus amylolentus CBS 6039]|uniref:Protein CPL1-like domain-containing protein n=2 Tax=Cryptococcus amylolentus TaxID=104669 RepID=A0A1E3I6W5_9TREE|nr:hypothetical protein L202_00340 [Cryptococcus amylolentus CBS 6039]ODN84379.1 hypothetical protein L202_00340 [Cryptococcus amylolentus CBS 6039]ODO11806.1 hypothetical protein I350_00590 [Cryptococcus amylolentus CBS 6273]
MSLSFTAPRILLLLLLLAIALPSLAAPADEPPSKLQPRSPQPSRRMGATKRSKKVEPLKKKDYSSFLCPGGSVACPITDEGHQATPESAAALDGSLNSLADWFKIGFECVELETELNSCGGCLALGSGQDCSLISNARATGCESGSCQVYSCFEGYVVSPDRKTCVKKGTATPATPVTAINIEDEAQLPLRRR